MVAAKKKPGKRKKPGKKAHGGHAAGRMAIVRTQGAMGKLRAPTAGASTDQRLDLLEHNQAVIAHGVVAVAKRVLEHDSILSRLGGAVRKRAKAGAK